MSELSITVSKKKRLLTAGKYCAENIVITPYSKPPALQNKTVTKNGVVTPDSGYNGLSVVTVNVPVPDGYVLPDGTKTITVNGTYDISGYASAEISVPVEAPAGAIVPVGAKTVTENGTYDIGRYAEVKVDVPVPDGYLLPAGTKAISVNGTHDVSAYAAVTVNVPAEGGGSECAGRHIIEVTELPTEGIDENAVYLCGGAYYIYEAKLTNVLFGSDSLSGLYPCFYHYAKTAPVRDIAVSSNTDGFHFYYIADENDVFAYTDDDGNGEYERISASESFGLPFGGVISDASEAAEQAVYAVVSTDWTKYHTTSGTQTITQNGAYDVSGAATVLVDVPDAAVVGAWQINDVFNLTTFPADDFHTVSVQIDFTAVIDGESKQCTGIEFYKDDITYVISYETDGEYVEVGRVQGDPNWTHESAQTVDFGTDPQVVPSAFKLWLKSNAVPAERAG